MADQCSTCAFREECETSKEPDNVLRSMVAVTAGLPFFCHHSPGFDYKTSDPVKFAGKMIDRKTGAIYSRPKICQGWAEKVRHAIPAGRQYWDARRRLRQLGSATLLAMIDYLSKDDASPTKELALQSLERKLKKLRRYSHMAAKAVKV